MFPFSGHAILMGEKNHSWQERDEVLSLFGRDEKTSRRQYEEFVRDGIKIGKRLDLVGGGLKRSNGGVWPSEKDHQCYDSRILGGSRFVEDLLKSMDNADRKTNQYRKVGWENFVSAVTTNQKIKKEQLFENGRRKKVSDGKAMLIYTGITYFGKTNKEMAQMTCMAEPSASRAKERGRMLLERLELFNEKGN